MISLQRIFFIIAIGSLIAGCNPESDNPLSDPDQARIDQNLIGTWHYHGEEREEVAFVHFGKGEKKGWVDMVLVDFKASGGVGVEQYTIFTTKLGQHYFMNLHDLTKEQEKKNSGKKYIFLLYEISGDNLTFRFMAHDLVVKSIENGELQGGVKEGSWFKEVTITDATENLARYILQSDINKLFPQDSGDKPVILKKIIH